MSHAKLLRPLLAKGLEPSRVVAIDSRSLFYVNSTPVTAGDLVPRVQRALADSKEKLVYVQGDKDAK